VLLRTLAASGKWSGRQNRTQTDITSQTRKGKQPSCGFIRDSILQAFDAKKITSLQNQPHGATPKCGESWEINGFSGMTIWQSLRRVGPLPASALPDRPDF
jgi:hypothetical protein